MSARTLMDTELGLFPVELHQHQIDGVNFMYRREMCGPDDASGIPGGIVCDEMGLGKTIQMLALIRYHFHLHPSVQPTLIVSPLAVIDTWVHETYRMFGYKPFVVKTENMFDVGPMDFHGNCVPSVVIASQTCFSTMRETRDGEQAIKNPLMDFLWGRVVLDEAHTYKKVNGKTLRQVCLLKAPYRWCLTGTPVVNTMRNKNKRPRDDDEDEEPMEKTNDIAALILFLLNDSNEMNSARALAADQACVDALILRRTKADIGIKTSDVHITLEFVDFSPDESRIYNQTFQTGIGAHPQEILPVITKLRQLCACSSKFEALRRQLQMQEHGSRSLVFVSFLNEMEEVGKIVTDLGMVPMFFHGGLSADARNELVREFMKDRRESIVFILQVHSGGVGLNLQKARYVYIMTAQWSAAAELQAISRAHRVNTLHDVHVVRFIMRHSIEEYIHLLQKRKLKTASKILRDQRIAGALASYDGMEVQWAWAQKLFSLQRFDGTPGTPGTGDMLSLNDSDSFDSGFHTQSDSD